MGHYDDSYEHSREQEHKEHVESLIKRMNKLSSKLKVEEMEIILDIVDDFKNWKGLYNLIKKTND